MIDIRLSALFFLVNFFALNKNAYLLQRIVSIAARANVLIHIVPIEILQFLGGKINARHFVCIVLRCLETIAVVNINRCVRMPWSISGHRDLGITQCNLMENSANREQIFFVFGYRSLNE